MYVFVFSVHLCVYIYIIMCGCECMFGFWFLCVNVCFVWVCVFVSACVCWSVCLCVCRYVSLHQCAQVLPGIFPRRGSRADTPCSCPHRAICIPACHQDLIECPGDCVLPLDVIKRRTADGAMKGR